MCKSTENNVFGVINPEQQLPDKYLLEFRWIIRPLINDLSQLDILRLNRRRNQRRDLRREIKDLFPVPNILRMLSIVEPHRIRFIS